MKSKLHFTIELCPGSETPYCIIAGDDAAKVLGRVIICYCLSLKAAEWILGVLETYYLLCDITSKSINKVIDSAELK